MSSLPLDYSVALQADVACEHASLRLIKRAHFVTPRCRRLRFRTGLALFAAADTCHSGSLRCGSSAIVMIAPAGRYVLLSFCNLVLPCFLVFALIINLFRCRQQLFHKLLAVAAAAAAASPPPQTSHCYFSKTPATLNATAPSFSNASASFPAPPNSPPPRRTDPHTPTASASILMRRHAVCCTKECLYPLPPAPRHC